MLYFIYITIPLVLGFMLDLIFGEPKRMKHPVMIIGALVSAMEKRFNVRGAAARAGGAFTAIVVCAASAAAAVAIPAAAAGCGFAAGYAASRSGAVPWLIHGMLTEVLAARIFGAAALTVMCWLMFAARSLETESMKVCDALKAGDTKGARKAVSMIVGRDTSVLDRNGIMMAAVETVAENTSDGVTAPVFWTALLGALGLYIYKAVNTMDSMIGYKNERYIDFGRFAARLDDVLNYIPSRLTALLIICAAVVLPGYDGRGAWRIWRRDRRKHASPNSAQTEAACAGALGLRLAGPAVYFGVLHDKPFIGDERRNIEPADIERACTLMFTASGAAVMIAAAAGALQSGLL